jgi:hypothetical protein
VEFFHKNEYVRSYSIYKHDTTLKMTFGANFFLDDFNSGPPIIENKKKIRSNRKFGFYEKYILASELFL